MILGAFLLAAACLPPPAISTSDPQQHLEEIRAAVILPQNSSFVASLPKVLPVLEMAAARVAPLLPGRRIVFYPADDKCDSHHALKNAVTAKMCPDDSQRIHVFFGPNCEYCVGKLHFHPNKFYNKYQSSITETHGFSS